MVGQDGAVHVADAVSRELIAVKNVQDERQQDPRGGKGRREKAIAVSESAGYRVLPKGRVVGQVLCGDDASGFSDVLDEELGEGSVVELVAVALGYETQGVAEFGRLDVRAGLLVAAVLVEEPFSGTEDSWVGVEDLEELEEKLLDTISGKW